MMSLNWNILRNLQYLPAGCCILPALLFVPAARADESPGPGWRLGADLYLGVSNLPGDRKFHDGQWIGYGRIYPSNLAANYHGSKGLDAKISLGLSQLYNGSVSGFDQPIEAYATQTEGHRSYTAGKFYVPFELQEWQYETEWGLQAVSAGDWGSSTGALTFNRITETANGYARFATNLTSNATLGLSIGAGRGFTFDSRHNKGAALDLTAERGRWTFESSAMLAQERGSEDRFQFAFGRVTYHAKRWSAFLSRHSWHDRSGDLGNGHYSTLGESYQINDRLSADAALSRSAGHTIRWAQLHWTLD